MAIQMRRGDGLKFLPSKLLPGEWAVVLDNDPTTGGRAVYVCYGSGIVKRMVTQEDMTAEILNSVQEIVADLEEATDQIIEDASADMTAATQAANSAATLATQKAGEADEAAELANGKAAAAQTAADDADAKASLAQQAATAADQAAQECETATGECEAATEEAVEAAASANAAASAAESAIDAMTGNILRGTVGPSEVASAQDAYPRVPLGMKVYGQTRQNLWVNPSATKNGITVTTNDDGSLTVSGTATAPTYIAIDVWALKPGAIYTLSIDKDANFQGFYISDIGSDGTALRSSYVKTAAGAVTFTASPDAVSFRFGIGIQYTGDQPSGTYRVMLNEGSEAEPWCPPGLHSVGELMPHEKNLWVNPSGTQNGVTVTPNEDGSLTIEGTATSAATIFVSNACTLKQNASYVASVDKTNESDFLFVQQQTGTYVRTLFGSSSKKSVLIETESDMTEVRLGVFIQQGTKISGTYRVMLNEGSIAQPWVPPGVESVVQIVTTGKNLVDTSGARSAFGITPVVNADGSVTINGTPSQPGGILMCADFSVKAGTYVLSGIKKGNPYGATRFELYNRSSDSPNNAIAYVGGSNSDTASFSLQEDSTLRLSLIVFSSQTYNNFTVYPQLELGSTATEYEPPNINTVPIDLQGNELCSLPDGTRDELAIDGSGNVVLRKKTDVFAATTSTEWTAYDDGCKWAAIPSAHGISNEQSSLNEEEFMCDAYPAVGKNWGSVNWTSYPSVAFSPSAAFVDKVMYCKGNGPEPDSKAFSVLYLRQEEQTIPLGTIQMPELPAPNANAWAAAEVPGEVELEYERDVTLVVGSLEAKVAALELLHDTE